MSLDKVANEIRTLCDQERYRQVLELFDRSKDLTLRLRENPDAAMKQFNPSKYTMGYLLALKYKLETNVGDPEVYLQQMTQLAEVFHVEQARRMIDILAFAFHVLTNILVDRRQPQRGLLPLLTAIRRLRESPSHLTSLHADYLCLCLAGRNLQAAVCLLDTDILSINYEVLKNTCSLTIGLSLYSYLGRLIRLPRVPPVLLLRRIRVCRSQEVPPSPVLLRGVSHNSLHGHQCHTDRGVQEVRARVSAGARQALASSQVHQPRHRAVHTEPHVRIQRAG